MRVLLVAMVFSFAGLAQADQCIDAVDRGMNLIPGGKFCPDNFNHSDSTRRAIRFCKSQPECAAVYGQGEGPEFMKYYFFCDGVSGSDSQLFNSILECRQRAKNACDLGGGSQPFDGDCTEAIRQSSDTAEIAPTTGVG